MTRATIIWFVGAAVVGVVAGCLHLLRSQIGGGHTGLPLTVAAFALTALAALMLFHGVMLAASAQDAAAGAPPRFEREPEDEPTEAPEQPDYYTFRAGKPVDDRPPRRDPRNRPSRG